MVCNILFYLFIKLNLYTKKAYLSWLYSSVNSHKPKTPHVNSTQTEKGNTTNIPEVPLVPCVGGPKTTPQFDDSLGDPQDSA